MQEVIDIHAEIKRNWSQPNEIVKKLTAENAKETTSEGNLPLHTLFLNGAWFSFKTGHLNIVKKLLELYSEGVKHKNMMGRLPVHCAIIPSFLSSRCAPSAELIEAVRCLLSFYPESLSMQDTKGQIYFCYGYVLEYFTKCLIDNHKEWIRMIDGNGRLPLHHAAVRRNADVIMLCGREFPEGTKHKDNEGCLPIHYACNRADGLEPLKVLISLDSGSTKAKDGQGDLPLHLVVRNYYKYSHHNRDEMCEWLLRTYPEGAKVRNNKGQLPYDYNTDENISYMFEKYSSSGFDIDQGSHEDNPIVRYLMKCPSFAKCRLENVMDILKVYYTARKKDAENIKKLSNQLKSTKNKLDEVRGRNSELERCRREDAERIQTLEHQLKTTGQSNIASNAESKLNEVMGRNTELEQRQKGDAERIQTLEDRLKTMDRSNIASNAESCNAPEHEVVPGVQLNKLERNAITINTLQEARKSELRFLHQVVQDKNDHWTLDQLKEMVSSLDSRVTLLREKLKPGEKPSNCQKLVALMFVLCEKGVETTRGDILDAIVDTNKELLVLERMDDDVVGSIPGTLAAAVSDDVEETTPEELEYLGTRRLSGSPENGPIQKRARVSISP